MPYLKRRPGAAYAAQAAIAGLAAFLLFWGLTEKYLWQDEASTAELASRMLKFGRPVAYDGVNLLTTDVFNPDTRVIERQSSDPRVALEFHRKHGEYKAGTVWKWQPWGLFVVAAAGIETFGKTTLGARLPFALAGFATVMLLFHLARKHLGGLLVASLAAVLLLANPYWILHARQCRYYALSSLFLVLTLICYTRWQTARRGAAAGFVAAVWCWFQVDYGTLWPVLAVLFAHSFRPGGRGWKLTLGAWTALGALIAPFVFYYEMWGRGYDQSLRVWAPLERISANLFNLNEYVAPVSIALVAVLFLLDRRKTLSVDEATVVTVSVGALGALALWIPAVSDFPHLRYAIIAAPAGAIVVAWVLVQACRERARWLVWPLAALLIVTPWASLPLWSVAPPPFWVTVNPWYRNEQAVLWAALFEHRPDPNRLVIEWLRRHAAPSDEILTNYEDVPLMYYLPNPVRGGLAAFRVKDDSKSAPRYVVLRKSVALTNWPIYYDELARHQWEPIGLKAPDVKWGNNPDTRGQEVDSRTAPNLYFARRIGQ